jgi:flagellar biosynthetic protein FlhB
MSLVLRMEDRSIHLFPDENTGLISSSEQIDCNEERITKQKEYEKTIFPILVDNEKFNIDKEVKTGTQKNFYKEVNAKKRQQFLEELDGMTLQWFAAEDEGRTEDPTEHKIKKAREEGKVAKSPDLSGSIVLLFSIVLLAIIGTTIVTSLADLMRYYLGNSAEIDITKDHQLGISILENFTNIALPIGVVAFIAALLGNIIQVGFLFSTKPIKPDFKRIAPNFAKYFKRTIFSTEAIYNLAKSFGKIIIIALIAFLNISADLPEIMNLVKKGFMDGFLRIAGTAFAILIEAAIVLLVLSAVDYMFQRKQHRDSLKMTKQEIKEERKTYEGDPLVKSRLRQRMREILQGNMLQKVPEADVVVTNPTHFAVALEYKQISMDAPTVTAKGQDHMAQRIKQVAYDSEVPVMENKPLARALFADVEIGETIPEKYYEAVVLVLKEVYRANRRQQEAV